ncbi:MULTISPECIES: tail fiber assembly protein [Photorhabdus]|uniref:Tail fiber protein of prophage cp-933x (Tail fiber assembl protein) n=2 Tax=Photorhabdus asymbiotica TaxID=291112 RepID=C7BSP4_PHOAA|nr:tail fiber assembly protein [Photorhabdus asymbiotica]RKS66348.1 virus tail fiber assembly protein lambda gpK [Photorhabdus asymbiotica]CAQ83738.1 putative tail fiber protein of prophage cp-933x (tail fiber assembl protein) [Photorhabdus asymbiotica]
MKNYYFDDTKQHHPFIGSTYANIGSEPPINALRVEPDFKDGFWPCEKSGQWILVENKKGSTIYDIESGQSQKNKEVIIPDGFTEQPCPSRYHKWDGKWVISRDAAERLNVEKNEEIKQGVESKKRQLMVEACTKIAPLQDAVDLDIATEAEKDALLAWKKYRVMLNRIDTSQAYNIEWPEQPK